MNRRTACFSIVGLLSAFLAGGCATRFALQRVRQVGESGICIGEAPFALAYLPDPHQPLRVRSTYLPSTNGIEYLAGRDFLVDYVQGTLRRTPGSRMPDFRNNCLCGQEEFDHTQFPGFGNRGYFVYVDYSFAPTSRWPVQASQTRFLSATLAKLKTGAPLKIVAFGDSITAGADAPQPELVFWRRWADQLQRKYPQAHITALNGATGGDTTVQGLERLQTKVLDYHPDLVLIGFGMNDHNVRSVPIPQFEQNLAEIIARIRSRTGAEVVLFSAFPPNPKWKFGSHHMADYAAATERVARQNACAYADVFDNWQSLTARKKPEDLLANNINHPNEFGHWIYFRVFNALGL